MFSRFKTILFPAVCLSCVLFHSCDKDDDPYREVIIDFQNVLPESKDYNNNAGAAGKFEFDGFSLRNTYNAGYNSWDGFSISRMHDMETRGRDNEYSVYAANNPEGNVFAIAYLFDTETVTFSQPVKNLSFDIANSSYAYWAMKEGDSWTKEFTEEDWYELTIVATTETGGMETVKIKLADGTKITNVWNTVSFDAENIVKLEFSLSSTDTDTIDGVTYMNNPSYFCIDNIKFKILE
jgi:hypothetical protein